MAYTPVELTKDGKTTWTQTLAEEIKRRWDGWLPVNSPTPDDSWDVVRHGDLRNPSSKPMVDLRAALGTVGRVKLQEFGSVKLDGSADLTSFINSALAELQGLGGGFIELPSGDLRIDGQIALPNDAATPPKQVPLGLIGQGAHFSGRGTPLIGGTRLRLTFAAGSTGKIQTTGLGLFVLQDLTCYDPSGDASAFFYTTNTTPHIRRVGFVGSKSGTACNQDAIILGGPNQVEGGGGITDGFQGYGGSVKNNFFSGIRRAAALQAFANGLQIVENTVWSTCGNSAGAAFDVNGKPGTGGQSDAGGTIGRNLIELANYKYGIELQNAVGFSIDRNDGYDAGGSTLACVHLATTASYNRVTTGYCAATVPYLIDDGGQNTYENHNGNSEPTVQNRPWVHRRRTINTPGGGEGVVAMDTFGNAAYLKALAPISNVQPYAQVQIASRPPTQVTDAVLTSGSRVVTSATAGFVATDVGLPIGATGIPSETYISRYVSATQVEITNAATATATGVTLSWGRLGVEQTHARFERAHFGAVGTLGTQTVGAAAGTGATVSVVGVDVAGTITLTTGTSPGTGVLANINHNISYVGTPHVMLTPANQAAAQAQRDAGIWWNKVSQATWSINCDIALAASTVYKWSYMIMQAA